MSCTATAIHVPDDLPFKRWEAALAQLGRAQRASNWWIGDLLVHAGKHYGETYDAAIAATGLSLSTLKNLKWVASKFPPDARREDRPWSVHRDLASLTAPDPVRSESGFDAASEWEAAGMPEYEQQERPFQVIVSCETEADRDEVMALLGSPVVHSKNHRTCSVWHPDRPKDDVKSLRFEDD